jgi:CRP-like cAMP-binding protein
MSFREETSSVDTSRIPGLSARLSTNKLLASLPAEDYLRILPHLVSTPLRAKETIFRQDSPLDGVLFPSGGACALVKTTESGHTAEIAVVGVEGAIGAGACFGLYRHPCDVMVQMDGPHAEMLPINTFSDEMERRGALYNRLIRYNQALMMQLMQSTACNSLHSASERCARWLLAMHDRAQQDTFPFTHDFTSMMLSLRRPTVTLVARSLQSAGLIDYARGTVRIANRAGLEAVSCACYHEVRSIFRRLLPDVTLALTH